MRRFSTLKLVVSTLLITSLLHGCGFKLRNDYQLAKSVSHIQLTSTERHSQLQKTLAQRLKFLDVEVIEAREQFNEKNATLYLQREKLERKLLSLFPSGQVAEYELLYQVKYQYIKGSKQENAKPESIEYEFVLSREYQDDPDQVLAKSRELDLILDELRQQAANRIIRTLSLQSDTHQTAITKR
ncbi:hypothetical protein KIH87_06205 [Paraneptunicella aestuarii]|nr:hypothetical protein KIH87_06205 [Paraneptunicella aestuarii]